MTYYTPRAAGGEATVTTIPIQSPVGANRTLTVNLDGAAGRPEAFAVELLDAATGEPIEGYRLSDCLAPGQDGIAVPVTWRGGDSLPAGRELRLRFHLRAPGVRLYSFGFRDRSAIP